MHKTQPTTRSARIWQQAEDADVLKASNDRLKVEFKRQIKQLSFDLGLPRQVEHNIYEVVDRGLAKARRRPYTMVTETLNFDIAEWLFRNSRYPKLALLFYIGLPRFLDHETNELNVSRKELAVRFGVSTLIITRLMAELKLCKAVFTVKRGRHVVYSLNVHVATKMAEGPRCVLEASTNDPVFPQLTLFPNEESPDDDGRDEEAPHERTG